MQALFAIAFFALTLRAEEPPTADQMMERVAKNQDVAQAAREKYLFHQNLLIRLLRPGNQLAREENRNYTVTPTATGVKRDLVDLHGAIGQGKKRITYDGPDFRYKNIDIDGEIVQSMADDFGNEKGAKDGVDHDMFPLSSKSLKNYTYRLVGKEDFKGHPVLHVSFDRKKHSDDDTCFAGDAYVDPVEYQPWMIATHFTCKVPLAVKIMLGTNIQQIGFKITYKKFEDGVWFPVTYGGEFKFRVLFGYARTAGVRLENTDFKKTQIETAIKYEQ